MLILFETPAGFALFKVQDEGKLIHADNLYSYFENLESAKKFVSLKNFHKFEDTAEALSSTTAIIEGTVNETLSGFLQKSIVNKHIEDKLAVADKKLGKAIRKMFPSMDCVYDSSVMELFRCVRFQLNDLLGADGHSELDMNSMSLGLAHSLGRYKLKFSPDKVDVMIVQAIALLDDLDKEINTYSMRVKEWYGWHFPELSRIVSDNLTYAKLVRTMGIRANTDETPLDNFLEESVIVLIKKAAKVSMGTEISGEDISHIQELCTQVIEIGAYREELYEYIKNRMAAIAPNLTILVGELVGARLIAHAGSLMNLAKHPASTVQILGAEKALFRALKTKKPTPKYGLIYHASLVGQATPKNKGKISRILANKTALSCRVDALGDEHTKPIGLENLEKVTARVNALEGRKASTTKVQVQPGKYIKPSGTTKIESSVSEAQFGETQDKKDKKKRKRTEVNADDDRPGEKKWLKTDDVIH